MEYDATKEDDLFINLEAVALEDGTYNGRVSFSEAMKSWTNQAGPAPVVVNVQGTGYYRVNYDKANGLALATDRMMIHRFNRAQIICDLAALYELDLVTQEVRDAELGYIDQQTEWGPSTPMSSVSGASEM